MKKLKLHHLTSSTFASLWVFQELGRPRIDWSKYPCVPRPSLIEKPMTAFGKPSRQSTQTQTHAVSRMRKSPSILDPVQRAAIKPDYKLLREPVKPYVSTRDKNRERILGMVRQSLDSVPMGNQSNHSDEILYPRLRNYTPIGGVSDLPVRREIYRNEKSGAIVTRYIY